MLRKVTISWLKQRSGMFALKGIAILEDNRSYDSSSNFRDEDAEWLTATLNAQANVELSGRNEYAQMMADYPKWASNSRQEATIDGIAPLVRERANTTLMRHLLTEIVMANRKEGEEDNARLQKLIHDAETLLRSTDCGTYYNIDEALSMLTKHQKKTGAAKPAG